MKSKLCSCIAIILLQFIPFIQAEDQTIFLAILARNKAHLLPHYLQCIERLQYPKELMTVYINTNDNVDQTEEILREWMQEHERTYHEIIFESSHHTLDDSTPHEWTVQRLKILGLIRNRSLEMAKQLKCAYYFVVDCDNFIAPRTLKVLIDKKKPIIAPMLYSIPEPNDPNSNFFYAVTKDGYYTDHPDYYRILSREWIGTFPVPLVHCTYLIDASYLDLLSYTGDTDEYEFIIFARNARNNLVDQYICNEEIFGTNLNFYRKMTLNEEAERVKTIPLTDFMLDDAESRHKE